MIPEKKVCNRCNEEKKLTEYHKAKTEKYGRCGRCKECVKAQKKKYRQNNREKLRAKQKKYYQENKEKAKEYYQKNKEERKEKALEYYYENPEKVKARTKKYREENPEKVKARERKYYQENIEKRKEYLLENAQEIKTRSKKYYQENKDLFIQAVHLRRARILENGYEHFTTKQLNEHWIQEGIDPENCYYCDEGEYEHLDHYVPIAKGGPHFMSNLRPSCASCNHSKHAKDPEEWITSRL